MYECAPVRISDPDDVSGSESECEQLLRLEAVTIQGLITPAGKGSLAINL